MLGTKMKTEPMIPKAPERKRGMVLYGLKQTLNVVFV